MTRAYDSTMNRRDVLRSLAVLPFAAMKPDACEYCARPSSPDAAGRCVGCGAPAARAQGSPRDPLGRVVVTYPRHWTRAKQIAFRDELARVQRDYLMIPGDVIAVEFYFPVPFDYPIRSGGPR